MAEGSGARARLRLSLTPRRAPPALAARRAAVVMCWKPEGSDNFEDTKAAMRDPTLEAARGEAKE